MSILILNEHYHCPKVIKIEVTDAEQIEHRLVMFHIVMGNDVIQEYDVALFPLEKTIFSIKY